MSRLERLDFAKSADGLLPAIVQHARTGAVLMLGYMNAQALARTRASGNVTFFSRSRQALWTKGETSGNFLRVVDVAADCDRDTLLVRALPEGPVCHLGTATCFDESADGVPGAAEGAGTALDVSVLAELQAVIAERAEALARGEERAADSYVAKLLARGPVRAAQKVGEEGVEVALAVAAGDAQELIGEAADLLFHLMVALQARGLTLAQVLEELARRRR